MLATPAAAAAKAGYLPAMESADGQDRGAPNPAAEEVATGQAEPAEPTTEQTPTTGGRDADDPTATTRRAPAVRKVRPRRRSSAKSAVDRVRDVSFPLAFRGYDKAAVDRHIAAIAQLVAELEASQLPETVVQRALDQVGEETSSILRRAHEAAEEISSRSRSQAEGRIQRAERDAEAIRRDADQAAERIRTDTRRLWQERTRLIEEIRRLAEETLATADEALDRLAEPGTRQQSAPGEQEPPPSES